MPVAAPFGTWVGAIAIAVAIAVGAWIVGTEFGVPAGRSFTEFNAARIREFGGLNAGTATARVVMIGSSALKYATPGEDAISAELSSAVGRRVAVLRIVSNWGTFVEFEPLAADLRGLQPELVVVESDLLATDRPRLRSFALLVEYARFVLGVDSPLNSTVAEEAGVQREYPCWHRKVQGDTATHMRKRGEWVTIRPDGPAAKASRRFLDSMVSSGAHVAVLNIPRRPDYDEVAKKSRRFAISALETEALLERVQRWDPGPLDAGFYCDVTHLTPAGQGHFTRWLESKIAASLKRGAT